MAKSLRLHNRDKTTWYHAGLSLFFYKFSTLNPVMEQQKSGKIRKGGGSNETNEFIRKALRTGRQND